MISYDSPQLVPYLYFSACDAAGYNGQWFTMDEYDREDLFPEE